MNATLAPTLQSSGTSLLQAERGQALLWLLLLGILALRIAGLALSNAELYYDEAQYWAWAQDPAFGYYTKPPLVAWVIAATTSLCGDTPFCVRLPSPIMHFAISLVIYATAAKLHSRRVGFWAALVYAVMPGTSISATLMSTDVPLLLFWALALLALAYHVERPSLAAGLAMGAAIGLGLNAKYAMGFFILCYAAYAIVSPKARASLRHPGTWAGLVVALAMIAPNLLWNAEHQFATFEHTRENADWGGRFPNVMGLLAFIGTQAAIIGPVPFAAFILAWRGNASPVEKEPRRLALAMSLPVFFLIAAQAIISKANGNWAATAFPTAVILATAVMLALDWRRGMIATMIISAVALVGITFAGSLAGTVTSGPIGRELGKMTGWGEFATKVRSLAETNDLRTVVFMGRGLTASMIYELRGSGLDIRTYAAHRNSPNDHFEMTRPWSPGDPGPVLLIYPGTEAPPAAVAPRARLVEQFKTGIFITRGVDWLASAYRLD
ncbi:glycosyltransferase family 39 protein [Mesorhizobium sp. BAC0120]|uniref:ArnT family glycosyltransferase n=1 Tax=Mesorhizobium sp. BAC0120 TaxID=3090670 RepID=UPI00298C63C5|nr:glycosyltransferase family 39 protein [Mesorhizobium sp. BAC0120]MDW6022141.1 glycosyltransferase family 39 protein [Mesorhizobium sp. BAC0120]